MNRVALYVRSADDPTAGSANWAIAAQAAGYVVEHLYNETTLARLTARSTMLRHAGSRFSVLIVPSLTTLGRSLPDLVRVIRALHSRGVNVRSLCEEGGADGVVAFMEALPVLDRVLVDLRRDRLAKARSAARRRGVKFGRPCVSVVKVQRLHEALERGLGIRAAAREAGIGVATASRLRDRLTAPRA